MKDSRQENRRWEPIRIRRVVGKSMWPVLDPGQVVLAVSKRQYEAEDVVLLWHQGKEKIKRIRMVDSTGLKYDVRGDNPSQSTDSRHFGMVEKKDVVGKVIWPRV